MSDIKQEKLAEIAKLLKASKDMLKEAQKIADEHGLSFRWSDEYGSSQQTYRGKGTEGEEYSYEKDTEITYIRKEGEWDSSSKHCP